MLETILLVVLLVLVIGALPRWNHSATWGYGPSGGLTIVMVVLAVLALTGRL